MEAEADKILEQGRRNFLEVTKQGVDLKDVETNCPIYGIDPSQMTNSRLFSRFMSRFRWYNPWASVNKQEYYNKTGTYPPSLDEAWAYYEFETLARYYVDETNPSEMVRAQMGDRTRPTQLYPYWRTPVKELMDFGVSVRLYFSTLLVLGTTLLVAGLFNIPLYRYFWNYAPETDKNGIDGAIRGSAICNQNQWVQCESCNYDTNSVDYEAYRLDGQNALQNTCDFDQWLLPGILSYLGTVVLVALCGIWFFYVQRKAEIKFDEEMQTASDYAIKITNPPPDATDPEGKKSTPHCTNQKSLVFFVCTTGTATTTALGGDTHTTTALGGDTHDVFVFFCRMEGFLGQVCRRQGHCDVYDCVGQCQAPCGAHSETQASQAAQEDAPARYRRDGQQGPRPSCGGKHGPSLVPCALLADTRVQAQSIVGL